MESRAGIEQNLDKIEHLVVLMMENRSFDHMLGYLRLDGVVPEVDGLERGMGNEDPNGDFHRVEPLGDRLINEEVLDPGHGKSDVRDQLRRRNGGFLKNYVDVLARNRKRLKDVPPLDYDQAKTLVLGYQRARDVPVYDFLARNYQVCDRWFSSVPGATWSNRLYALTGGEAPPLGIRLPGPLKKLGGAPIYDRKAFVRWLQPEQWRWYSHDPATLRMVDSKYRPGGAAGAIWDDNFAYFNRKTLLEQRTFLDDAADGRLPAVSWIDPNFVDFRLLGPPGSNDDHPPSTVMLGQELVLNVVRALMRSPQWEKTALLITYDEHGGFFDHVPPGDFAIPGDQQASYGVRVPAIVVSPFVDRGVVNHTVFDHTSIIKTILLRFAAQPRKALKAMGPRTDAANHLGELLTRDKPRRRMPQELEGLVGKVAAWKKKAYPKQLLEEPQPGERLFDALTDLQGEIVKAATFLRKRVTPGKP
jgi:phospholipase C